MPDDVSYAIVQGKRMSVDKAQNAIMRLVMAQLGFLSDEDVRVGYVGDVQERKPKTFKVKPLENKAGTKGVPAKRSSAMTVTVPAGPLNNATLAYIHEHGTATIPARPFLIPVMDQSGRFVQTELAKAMRGAITKFDKGAMHTALMRIGLYMQDKAKENINEQRFKELSERRKKQKERITGQSKEKALILTGQLLNAITFEVGPRHD